MSELFPEPEQSTYRDFHRRYYLKNKEQIAKKKQEYRLAHLEEYKIKERERCRAYKAANAERLKKRRRELYAEKRKAELESRAKMAHELLNA